VTLPAENARQRLVAAQGRFDDLFRHDAGRPIGACFAADGELLWPEQGPVVGPAEIGAAFAEFADVFATISYETNYDLVEVMPPLAVVMGTFIEVRRDRASGVTERVHGRAAYVWREDPSGDWRCLRLMTGRYAPTEVVQGHP